MPSFIENVNKLARKLDILLESNALFDDNIIPILEEIAELELKEAIQDLKKGNHLGNRKIDINLALNRRGITEDLINKYPEQAENIWTDLSGVVLYDSCDITFVDGEVVTIDFEFDGNPISISTNGDLLMQLSSNTAFKNKLENTLMSRFAWDVVGDIVRLYDVIGQSSNLENIQLHAVSGAYIEPSPVYYWAKTSSSFQTLSMRSGDIIKLGNDIDSIIILANRINEILELHARIPELVDTYTGDTPNGDQTIYNTLDELMTIYAELEALIVVYNDIKPAGTNYIQSVATDLQGVNNIGTVADNITNINAVATNVVPNITDILSGNTIKGVVLSTYSSFSEAISNANTLGKSLIIDQPVDLGGETVDCHGVGLVWLSEGNPISNGTMNINDCHITTGRFKIFNDGVTLLGTPDLTPVEEFEPSSKEYTDTKVSLIDNETIDGIKTFSSNIIGNISTATKLQTARTINGVPFDGATNITVSDATAVKLTGNQTINGIKTFTSSPIVPTPTTNFQSVPLRSSNITIDVGAGQAYTTINQALEYLSGFYPKYIKNGVTATINLKAGFVMAEQVLVRGIDLYWVTIVGEDTETVINHTALTIDFTTGDYGSEAYPAFGVSKGGTLPRIGQLFRFNVAGVMGHKNGVMAIGAGSSAEIMSNKGVKNAGYNGIYATRGSTIHAENAIASGAGYCGIFATRGSTISAQGANANGSGHDCITATRGSTIHAENAIASGGGVNGIAAGEGSIVNARYVDASGAGEVGILAGKGSTINAQSANASGAEIYGIYVGEGSTINANGATGTLRQAKNTLTSDGIIYQ